MRRTKLIKDSGPYHAWSQANGRVTVVPSYPMIPLIENARIPGVTERLALAKDIERLLNGGKSYEEVRCREEKRD